MALRKSTRTAAPRTSGQTPPEPTQELTRNPETERRIDEFIKNNPRQFAYYNSLTKERLVRAAILKDIEARDRAERTRSAILRKLNSDPEMKESVEAFVHNLPEEEKRAVRENTVSRAVRTQVHQAGQKPGGGA